jgi:hypothetical protein
MAGVHVGLVAADPGIYEPFADQALSEWVRDRWVDVFMAAPATWGLAVATGELALGVLLLLGGRWARAGYVGVIGFHLALMLFGWGFWVWSVPALALLLPLARSEFRHGELAAQAATPTRSPQPPGNQIVLWLLRRGLVGKGLCALRLRGRRTGRLVEFPVQYAASSRDIVIAVGHPESKTWWRNFEQPHPVDVLLARGWTSGLGRLVPPGDAAHRKLLALHHQAHPRVPAETHIVHIRLHDVEQPRPDRQTASSDRGSAS